jgi:hypothetical protein
MTMTRFDLNDERGYAARRDEIDNAILNLLAEGEKTPHEIGIALRGIGVGNAESDDKLEIAYSMTGAIQRSAINALRRRGLIYDTCDTAMRAGGKPQTPYRISKVGA